MPNVQIKKNQIHVGSKKISLISGEVHYWRLNPGAWKDILLSVRNMGLRTIATYIPWDYHEYQRGKFDFHGKTEPSRNLKAFLQLTKKLGFWVIIRPGPYIYSEWPNEGAPAYAHRYHRLHPQFQQYAMEYLRHVVPILKPFQATRPGGNIILLQADNEIDPWPDMFGMQYGLSGKPGMFQDFMRDLYAGNLDALNEAWGTEYASFDQVGPFIATMLSREGALPIKGDKELKRNLDYLKFKYHYSEQYARWAVNAFRKLGITVPVYLNLYPFFYAHDWVPMKRTCDLVGIDLYPSGELHEDQFEQRKILDKVRYLKSFSGLGYIAEFESGVWHARHYESGILPPNHYRLLATTALMGGSAGWNWYMLVNRDNWYMSPINEWGRVRNELYDVFKQVVSLYKTMQPFSLTKLTDIAVTFNPLQYAARSLGHDSPILTALYDGDVDYEAYDPRFGKCEKKVLFYSGNQWLETAALENLRKYVEAGGTLVAFRDYPRKDDSFMPNSTIGFEEPVSTLFEFKRQFKIRLSKSRPEVAMNSSVYTFEPSSGETISADFGSYGRLTVAYIKKIGKGRILHFGMEPTRALILEILAYLGVTLASCSTTRAVKTALFKHPSGKFYLVATNNGDEDKSATVELNFPKGLKTALRVADLTNGHEEKFSFERRHSFSFEIPRKDGKVFEFRK